MDIKSDADTVRSIRFDRDAKGDPVTSTTTKKEWYADPTGAFKTGIWTAQPGKAQINYTSDELCTILDGTVRLTDASGRVETYKAGDTFVIPKGFVGTWETVTPVRKFYAVHKARSD